MLFHFNSHIFGCFLAAFFLIVSHVARYAPSSSEEIASKIISNILSVNFQHLLNLFYLITFFATEPRRSM